MRVLIIVSILSSAAAADPSVVRLGHVNGGSVTATSAVLRSRSDSVRATLTLVLASPSKTAREVGMRLALPPGAIATGLSLNGTQGDQYFTADGRARYEQVAAWEKDPALLEQVSPGVLALRVYPVSRGASATVTIDVLLPVDASLVVTRPGAERQTFEATELDVFETPIVGVDAESSIVAVPPAARSNLSSTSPVPRGWRAHEQTLPPAPDAALEDVIGETDLQPRTRGPSERRGRT